MRTVVIVGGTRGIGGALAGHLRDNGDRVVALGRADADLSSMRQTAALVPRLPDRIDALVLAAGRFSQRRIVTEEGHEQTFAITVLSRYLLTERLRPALERTENPVVLNLCGVGGLKGGRVHWDDLSLANKYSLTEATMQTARANDLLGVGFGPSRIRYVLYNPLMVNSGMHRYLRQPARALVGTAAALFGSSTRTAAARLVELLAEPPTAPLTALRRGKPVPLTASRADAERLYQTLDGLLAQGGEG